MSAPPDCRFGTRCNRRNCRFDHPNGRTAFPSQPAAASSSARPAAAPAVLSAGPSIHVGPGRFSMHAWNDESDVYTASEATSEAESDDREAAFAFRSFMSGGTAPRSTSTRIDSSHVDLDPARFIDAIAVAEVTCAICLNVCNQPLSLACSHLFCRACLEKLPSHAQLCPECRTPFDRSRASVNHFVVKRIENLAMRCPRDNERCTTTVTLASTSRAGAHECQVPLKTSESTKPKPSSNSHSVDLSHIMEQLQSIRTQAAARENAAQTRMTELEAELSKTRQQLSSVNSALAANQKKSNALLAVTPIDPSLSFTSKKKFVCWEIRGVSHHFRWSNAFFCISNTYTENDHSWSMQISKEENAGLVEVGLRLKKTALGVERARSCVCLYLCPVITSFNQAFNEEIHDTRGFHIDPEACREVVSFAGAWFRCGFGSSTKYGITLSALERGGFYNMERDSIMLMC